MPFSQQEEEVHPSSERRSQELPLPQRIYIFDKYRLDARERRLWREGVPVTLPPKVLDLLHVLLEHAGQLIEKKKLLRMVWPHSFVEEGNLTVYISVLRKTFNKDCPDVEFIETIPKSGYRFAVSTQRLEYPESIAQSASPDIRKEEQQHDLSLSGLKPHGKVRDSKVYFLWIALGIFIVAVILFFSRTSIFTSKTAAKALSTYGDSRPLIGMPGFYSWPVFSLDGRSLAYAWRAGTEATRDIYIQGVNSDSREKLTTDGGDNFSPAWSPRGDEIAFLHVDEDSKEINIDEAAVAMPHVRRHLASIPSVVSAFHELPSLAWSPDGQWLVTSEKGEANGNSGLVLISSKTGEKTTLTTPPPQTVDDNAIFSPDSRYVAFLRARGPSSGQIFIVPTIGGVERLLPFPIHSIDGLTWSADSQSLIVASARAVTVGSLWRVNLNGDPPVALSSLSAHASDPTLSYQAHRLAYVDVLRSVSLWRMRADGREEKPDQLIASNFIDSAPDYSPDGSEIAFESDRSGASEIWVCRSDGKQARRVTNIFGPMTGSPRWSPDGSMLAFDSRINGRSAIFVVSASGGTLTRMSTGGFEAYDNVVPGWSHDGRFLYFSSNRSGRWEIWRKKLNGMEETQITKQGGFHGVESADGKYLYYVQNTDKTSIWKLRLSDGLSKPLVDGLGKGMWGYWAVHDEDLFYLRRVAPGSSPAMIFRLNLKTRATQELGRTQFGVNKSDKGLAVSPDGAWLLYAQRDVDRTSIMVADNWQ